MTAAVSLKINTHIEPIRVKLDLIASVTRNVPLSHDVELLDTIDPVAGTVVVVEALADKVVYNELELPTGELQTIHKGHIIAGVLGERKALRGYVGHIPAQINVGDILHLLNKGGTIGLCTSANAEVGDALPVRVLGAVKNPFSIPVRAANIKEYGVAWRENLPASAPIILISGTCMNSGKTSAGSAITQYLTEQGYKVGFAKLTGVALMRDTLTAEKHGAVASISFANAGLPSTTNPDDILPASKGILHHLNETAQPDVIVAELGDGIMGGYSVNSLLHDEELHGYTVAHIMCANDPVGAWGAAQIFQQTYGLSIDAISGPVTDNAVGIEFCEQELGIKAANARSGSALGELVKAKL